MLTDEIKRKFQDLACRLSENLHCDGEISHAQARRKAHYLNLQWQKLEVQAGRRATEDEVWSWE